jgi:hypothetical protein
MSEIEDRLEIENLQTVFAHAADRGDYTLLRSLYTDDAVDDHGGYSGPVDGYIEWVKKTHEAYEMLSHICGKPLIRLAGDEAESEMKGLVFMRLKGPPAHNAFAVTRAFDKYARTSRGWRFTSRKLCGDWMGPAFEPEELGGLKGTMDGSDPVYAELPWLIASLRAEFQR